MKAGKIFARKIAYALLGSPWALRRRLDRIRESGSVTILNLHRVHEADGSDYPPLEPVLFDELLGFVSARFSIVTFATMDQPAPRPRMILSFDDGYRDFIEVAAPLLDKHRLPANQNIIPGCVESRLPPLNVMAQDFVGKAPASLVRALDVPGFVVEPAPDLGTRLSMFLKNRSIREQVSLAEVLVPQFQRFDGFRPTAMMSLDEVRQLADRHEIGGHSFSHASMAFETDDYLRDDLARCRAWFADKLNSDMTIYAFPNGSVRAGQVDIALSAGIEHVLLVGEHFDREGRVHHRFTFGATDRRETRFRALGALAPIPA